MTCKKWRCWRRNHLWSKVPMYKVFGQSFEDPSTGFELLCARSGEWVRVTREIFNEYYSNVCMNKNDHFLDDGSFYVIEEGENE